MKSQRTFRIGLAPDQMSRIEKNISPPKNMCPGQSSFCLGSHMFSSPTPGRWAQETLLWEKNPGCFFFQCPDWSDSPGTLAAYPSELSVTAATLKTFFMCKKEAKVCLKPKMYN